MRLSSALGRRLTLGRSPQIEIEVANAIDSQYVRNFVRRGTRFETPNIFHYVKVLYRRNLGPPSG